MRAVGAGRWGRALRCGPFTGERYAGSLRWLRIGDRECIRMVGLVVRDRAWRTLAPATVRERQRAGGWTINGHTPVGSASLAWSLSVARRADGIDVRATMIADGDVVINRAGIVVLLPTATFAGAGFIANHASGGTTRGRLTRTIAAHQPMLDLGALRVAARGGPVLSLRFEGDIFEMEDQRNWLDPSFKLYNRALSRPVPYRIRHGTRVEQHVVIDVVSKVQKARPARPARRPACRGKLPALGIATAPSRVPDHPDVIDALGEASPAFILHRTDREARGVRAAARLANSLGAALRVETFGDSTVLANAIGRTGPASIAPYFSGPHLMRQLLAKDLPITGGSFADFVMLNRNTIAPHAIRVAFALCPTVHARDDRSLIETLDTLTAVFDQARGIAGTRPLQVGPCTLLRRLAPPTGRPATRGSGAGADDDVDPRQHALIAGAWLTSTIALAAVSGVSDLCTFEGEGVRGLVWRAGDSAVQRSPAHAVLVALGDRAKGPVKLIGLNAEQGAAFFLEGQPAELWLVDLGGRPRVMSAAVRALGRVQRLDCTSGGARWSVTRVSRRLRAYSVLRIDLPASRLKRAEALARAWCGQDSTP